MATLRYIQADITGLVQRAEPGTCTIRPTTDDIWMLWFFVATQGHPEGRLLAVPVLPGQPPATVDRAGQARHAWGLTWCEPGAWQVSPSISYADAATGDTWHETPLIIDVPEPPPWKPPA